MFRLNLYLPLVLVTILMALLTVFAAIYIQENSIHKSKAGVSKQFIYNLDEKVSAEADIISEYIDFIQNRDDITNLFLAQDKQGLNDSVKKVYTRLNRHVDLTHMYFIKTDGTVFLRVHDYEKDQDVIDRVTFKKAKERESLFYGLEFGPKKNYTLRVVKPWIDDGKIIGYIELGKEIDKIINNISISLKSMIYIAVKKEVFSNASESVKHRLLTKKQTKDYYIVYNTFTIPKEMEYILSDKLIHKDITHEGVDYFVSKERLSDVSGKELGYFVFLSDVSLEHRIMYGSIKILSLIILLITALLIGGGYILIKNREKNIYRLTSRLEKKKNDLALFNTKLQKLFDFQQNIIVLTNGKSIAMANQAMLDFFRFKDIDDFSRHHKCICDRFVPDDSFFHLDKVDEGKSWIDTVKNIIRRKTNRCNA